MNLLYYIGAVLIAAGGGCIYAAGMHDGKKAQEAETWRDANDSTVGSVGDVRGEHHGIHSVGDSA